MSPQAATRTFSTFTSLSAADDDDDDDAVAVVVDEWVSSLVIPPAILSSHDEKAADCTAMDGRAVRKLFELLYREAFAFRSTCRNRMDDRIACSTLRVRFY